MGGGGWWWSWGRRVWKWWVRSRGSGVCFGGALRIAWGSRARSSLGVKMICMATRVLDSWSWTGLYGAWEVTPWSIFTFRSLEGYTFESRALWIDYQITRLDIRASIFQQEFGSVILSPSDWAETHPATHPGGTRSPPSQGSGERTEVLHDIPSVSSPTSPHSSHPNLWRRSSLGTNGGATRNTPVILLSRHSCPTLPDNGDI
jgi:hypothetical protein